MSVFFIVACGMLLQQGREVAVLRSEMTFRQADTTDQASPLRAVTNAKTGFDTVVGMLYSHAHDPPQNTTAKPFTLSTWTDRTQGGLLNPEREKIAEIYGKANSLFEWGLGESSYIAAHVGMKRYAGVDSDPIWVDGTRKKCPDHFRFTLADIGPTQAWGHPAKKGLKKMFLDYQVAPLSVEQEAFDVYMVDGRMRLACVCTALLHASSRDPSKDPTVLLHDYARYHKIERIADVVDRTHNNKLAVLKRKANVMDAEIIEFWEGTKYVLQ